MCLICVQCDQGRIHDRRLGLRGRAERPKEVYDFLKARKSSLLTKEGANVFAASFLILSHLQNSGSYVQGSFQLTNKAMEELWNTKMIVKPKIPAFGSAHASPRRTTTSETHPNLRHDPPRRLAGRRHQLLLAGQAGHHPAAR